jgi:N-acetylglucosaminyldiphosphoundecaprenol N-acetyl-beta-D-mannosaminyltransferase
VSFDVLDRASFVASARRFFDCGGSHVVHFLAVHPTVAARHVPSYGEVLGRGDLVVPDGAPIVAVMRRTDSRSRRLTSTDGFLELCRTPGIRHYFVGGSSDEVASAVRSRLQAEFPTVEIAGFVVPPFRAYTDGELARLAADVRESRADVVWVGIGAPKQEVLAHQLRKLRAAPMIACIGATFDFVAGSKTRAPAWLRAAGLEWLYRLAQEPRRLWRRYLIGNASFVSAVVVDALRGGPAKERPVVEELDVLRSAR